MNQPLLARPVPQLDPVHDGRHRLRDLPLERESIPYVISLPEHGLAAAIYTWVSKDHLSGALLGVLGPTVGDTPIFEAVDGIAMSPDQNFDDWHVGPVHLSQDLRMQTSRLKATSARAQLDVVFEALHPAYAYGFHPDGCPAYAATNRIEQAGRVRGTLVVDGKSYVVDTTGARDHSWGTRDWNLPQHWKWLHAQSGETCVHFWQIQVEGRIDLRGYVYRDGLMAEVRNLEVDFALDDQARQQRIDATVQDTAGRTTRVTGEYFTHFPVIPVPTCTLLEGAMRCEIDGKAGSGWTEFMWPTGYLEYLKSRKP
jgi:hypothetical protein